MTTQAGPIPLLRETPLALLPADETSKENDQGTGGKDSAAIDLAVTPLLRPSF